MQYMETLLNILNKTTAYFEKYEVEHARLDAELLLAHVLKCQRMQLYLNFERPMEENTLQELRPLLKRRASREPIQYIIGTTGFMDFELFTDKRALIPRPETEELIELISQDFAQKKAPMTVLDLGTGTGAIACALARLFPECKVVATDISSETLELARKNGEHLNLQDQIDFVESDWFDAVKGSFDLIVSNPPYLSDAELLEVQPELRNFEPERALTSGETGMEAIEILLSQGSKFLNPGGALYLETGCEQESAIQSFSRNLGVEFQLECLPDMNGKQRFVRFVAP